MFVTFNRVSVPSVTVKSLKEYLNWRVNGYSYVFVVRNATGVEDMVRLFRPNWLNTENMRFSTNITKVFFIDIRLSLSSKSYNCLSFLICLALKAIYFWNTYHIIKHITTYWKLIKTLGTELVFSTNFLSKQMYLELNHYF